VHQFPVKRSVTLEPLVDIVCNAVMSANFVEQFEHHSRTERVNGSGHSLPPLTTQFDYRGHGSQKRNETRRARADGARGAFRLGLPAEWFFLWAGCSFIASAGRFIFGGGRQ
jgi:hypothetical protein